MAKNSHQTTRPSRVTILDVARAAGVSKSSVSRLLDERLPRSNSEVAQRVRRVAKELGYVRDVSAANLRRGSTGTIGLIVPRLTDTVMALLYEALQRAAAKSGKVVIVATSDETIEAERRAADGLIGKGVDALILATARNDDPFVNELAERGVKYVLALRTDGKSLSSIGNDELGGLSCHKTPDRPQPLPNWPHRRPILLINGVRAHKGVSESHGGSWPRRR